MLTLKVLKLWKKCHIYFRKVNVVKYPGMTLQKTFHQKYFYSNNWNNENLYSWKCYYWPLFSVRANHGHFVPILHFSISLLVTNLEKRAKAHTLAYLTFVGIVLTYIPIMISNYSKKLLQSQCTIAECYYCILIIFISISYLILYQYFLFPYNNSNKNKLYSITC